MNWQPCLGLDLDIPPDFGHWFAGFTDGEGCFSIRASYTSFRFSCRFYIELRDDDAPILHKIRETLRVGHLYPTQRPNPNHHNSLRWKVAATPDHIHVIIPLFEKYPLRAKKARDFTLWKQAARLIHAKAHHTEHGRQEILRLKTQLQNARQYNGHNPNAETVA